MLKPQLLRSGVIAFAYLLIGPSTARATHKVVFELNNSTLPTAVQSSASIGISSLDNIALEFNAQSITAVLPCAESMEAEWPRLSRMYTAIFPDTADTTDVLIAYRADAHVALAYGDSDSIDFYSTIPTDEFFHFQWHLNNTGQQAGTDSVTDIDASQAWDFTEGSSTLFIGIIDSGIIRSHPDVIGQLWTNSADIPGGGDGDLNCYPDDTYGWDFLDNDGDPEPPEYIRAGHGMSTAGIIIGKRSDEVSGGGIVGVAHGCRLVCTRLSNIIDPGTPGAGAMFAAAIQYVVMMGARIVSMSVGLPPTAPGQPALMAAIEDIATNHPDVLLVMAAGNGQTTSGGDSCRFECAFTFKYVNEESRAAVDSVRMPIANICFDGTRVPTSCYLPVSNLRQTISVGAPGGGAKGPCHPDVECLQDVSHYVVCQDTIDAGGSRVLDWAGNFGGTSTAAPMVAGIAGLVRSDDPDLSAAQTKFIIEKSAIDVVTDSDGGSVPGYDIYTGYGVANAHRALLYPWVKTPSVAGLSYWAGDTLHVRWRKPKWSAPQTSDHEL